MTIPIMTITPIEANDNTHNDNDTIVVNDNTHNDNDIHSG